MGMFSEIATEATIQTIVAEIKAAMRDSQGSPEAVAALKRVGRFALAQFEWDTPEWAAEYKQLFEEKA